MPFTRNEYDIDVLCERAVAQFFRNRGWYVIPTCEYNNRGSGNAAPMCFSKNDGIVLADLNVLHEQHKRRWVEVKYKTNPVHWRKTDTLEHGIDTSNYEHYQRLQRVSGDPVWIAVVEFSPLCNCTCKCGRLRARDTIERFEPILMIRELDAINGLEPRKSPNSNNDMVSWPRDSFVQKGRLGYPLKRQVELLQANATQQADSSAVHASQLVLELR